MKDSVLDKGTDFTYIMENQLKEGGGAHLIQLCPLGYSVVQQARTERCRGEVAALYKTSLLLIRYPIQVSASFESTFLELAGQDNWFTVCQHSTYLAIVSFPKLCQAISALALPIQRNVCPSTNIRCRATAPFQTLQCLLHHGTGESMPDSSTACCEQFAMYFADNV